MSTRERALLLAAFQVGDLAVALKAVAVAALLVTSNRRSMQWFVGAALVSYCSAAVTFRVFAGDEPRDVAPAIACGVLAASLL